MTPTNLSRALDAAGAVVFALPLLSVWREPVLPPALPILASLIFAVTVARPAVGLGLLATFLPVAPVIQALGGLAYSTSAGQLLVLPFLAAGFARFALTPAATPARLTHPAWILAIVVAASGVAFTAASLAPASIISVGAQVWVHVTRDYFAPFNALPDLHVTAAWIEALALAVLAERVLRPDRQMAASVMRLAITGAAVTALFTMNHVARLAVASDAPLGAAVHAIRTMRFNPFYSDLNAAGSLQALYLVPAVWMAVTRRERWLWLAVAAIGLTLWFSGSRAAILAALGGAAVAWALGRHMPRRWWVAAVVLVAGVSAVAVWSLRPGRATVGEAIAIRWNLAVASLQVTATDPVVGVGPGRMKAASAPFITPEFARFWRPAASGENAHNNFLQVLAESGVLGFVAFVWMLAATVGPRARWREHAAADPLWPGSVGGLAAFLLTCLFGHPLLIEPARFCFFLWIALATAGASFEASSARRWRAAVVAASFLLVAAMVPGRISAARRAANLEGVMLGVGPHAGAVDGVNYRIIERESSWFIGTWGTSVEWAIRADVSSALPCRVEIDLDHQQASVVSIGADAWTPVRLILPAAAPGQGSRRLDVHVRTDGCTVLAGSLRTR